MTAMKAVVLAGGPGTRLAPLALTEEYDPAGPDEQSVPWDAAR